MKRRRRVPLMCRLGFHKWGVPMNWSLGTRWCERCDYVWPPPEGRRKKS